MMGQQCRSESLFYYFRIEDHVPEHHLLRAIDRYINFDFVREKLKAFYSETGRPSIDPERLLRILLIGYLYGVTSERKLIEELRMHLAWRWFTGLSFDQEVPHHSTFSKNRHGRFQESRIFEQLFHGSSSSALHAASSKGSIFRLMEASYKLMRVIRAAYPANISAKLQRLIELCGSIWTTSRTRILSNLSLTIRRRYRQPIQMQRTSAKATELRR